MITIHHEKETDFSKNGYGAIDDYVMSQEVTWEMNGQFNAFLEYPAFLDKSKYLVNKNILRVPVPFMEDQLFRIYRVRKVLGFIQVEARHIFYDLMDNLIEDTNIVGKTGSQAIQQLLGATQYEHRFIGLSDISTSNNARMVRYNPVEALLDDSKANTFVSRWGGEIVRDNFLIRMARQMGTDRGVRIQHRKDLTAYIATIDESTVVTRIMPVGFDGLKLPELYIDSPLLDPDNPKIGVIRYENVKAAIGEYADDNGAVPLEEAYELLREHARAEFNTNHLDEPEMTVTVNFVTLHNTKEYAGFAQLQEIHQGDVVRVSVPEEGFEITSRLVAFTSDPLQQNHYTSTTLGNHVYEFTSSTNSVSTLKNEVEALRESVVEVRQSANGKNQSFWGQDDPNTLNLNAILGDTYFRSVGEEDVIYQYVEVDGERYWKEIINTANTSEVKKEVERVAEEAEKLADDITEAQQSADDAKRDAGLALTASEALEIITQETASQLSDTRGLLATVESNASEAWAKADSALSQAGQAITDAYTAQTTAQSAISQAQSALSKANSVEETTNSLVIDVDNLAGEVSLKADSSTVNTLQGTVSSQGTTLTQQAGLIASKANQSEVDTVKGTVSEHTSTLSQHSTAISARLTQSQVDSLVNGKGYSTVSYVDNQISATATDITAELTRVKSLSIKNLFTDRFFSEGLDGWVSDHEDVILSRSYRRMMVQVSNTTSTGKRIYNNLPLTKDRVYNFSFKFIGRSDGFVEVGQGGNGERIRFERINGEKVISGTFRSNGYALSIFFPSIGTMEFTDMMLYESSGVTSTDIANMNARADGFDLSITNMNNNLENNYATKTYTNTQIETKAGEIYQSLSTIEERLDLNLLDLTRLANESTPNITNPNVHNYVYQGKPNTKYTLSTNIPIRGSTRDLFIDAPNLNPGSISNGVGLDSPRTVTTDATGKLYIGYRPDTELPTYTRLQDILGGRYWIILSEGSVALELADSYATKRINELTQTVDGWESTIAYINGNTTKINQVISTVDSYTQILGTNGEKIGQLVLSDSEFQTTIGEYSRAKQLLANSDFKNGTSDWSFQGNSTWSYDSTNKHLTMSYANLSGESRIYAGLSLTPNVTYTVKIRAKSLSASSLKIGTSDELAIVDLKQDFDIYTVSIQSSSGYKLSVYKLNQDGTAIIDYIELYEEGVVTTKQLSDVKQTADSIQALVGTTNESVARAVMTSSLWETEVASEIESALESTTESKTIYPEVAIVSGLDLNLFGRGSGSYRETSQYVEAITTAESLRVYVTIDPDGEDLGGNGTLQVIYGGVSSNVATIYKSLRNFEYFFTLEVPADANRGGSFTFRYVIDGTAYRWGAIKKVAVYRTEVVEEETGTGAIASKISQLSNLISLALTGSEGDLSSLALSARGVSIKGEIINLDGKVKMTEAFAQKLFAEEVSADTVTAFSAKFANAIVGNLDVNNIGGNKASFIQLLLNGTNTALRATSSVVDIMRNDGSISTRLTQNGMEIWRDGSKVGAFESRSSVSLSGALANKKSISMTPERDSYISLGYYKSGETTSTRVLSVAGDTGRIYIGSALYPSESSTYGLQIQRYILNSSGGIRVGSTGGSSGIFIGDFGHVSIQYNGTWFGFDRILN